MAYQGWNREEMRAAGSAMNHPSNPNHSNSTYFTPINHHRTPLSSSRPLDPGGRMLNSDHLYELRDETLREVPTKTAKKRGSIAPKSRVVSLGRVWEYEDEEDIHNNGVACEELLPKMKKTTISKRSQSMKMPSTDSARWVVDEEDTTHQGEGYGEQASQLTTPQDSFKRKQSKVGRGASKAKGKQMPAFKNPTITKPSVGPGKKTAPARSNSIISHQGWRSTEDSVKSTPVVLAKTTMQRLASFRFKPPPDPHPTHASHPPLQNVSSDVLVDDLSHEPLRKIAHASSDYDLPSEDSFFNEALWVVRAHTPFNDDNEIEDKPVTEFGAIHAVSEKSWPQEQPTGDSVLVKSAGDTSSRAVPPTAPFSAEYHSRDLLGPCEDNVNPYDPTSSEARALDDLITTEPNVGHFVQPVDTPVEDLVATQSQSHDVEMVDGNVHSIASKPQNLVDQLLPACHPDRALGVDSPRPADCLPDYCQIYEDQHGEAPHIIPGDHGVALISQDNDHNKVQNQTQLLAAHQALGGHLTDVQVERSDIDELETASKEACRDLWGSDEFDQGLDDDDLLAVASNAAVPQTPEKWQPAHQKNPKTCGRFLLPSTPVGPKSHAGDPTASPATGNIIGLNSSLPRDAPDLDDEFPMDDGDEEEMLKLSELGGRNKERFSPLESVSKAFNDLADAEVYDSSLQFSPPKPQDSGASPVKVTRGQYTDKSRSSRSPGHGKESLPLGEEEDWSFIRSAIYGEAETMSDPFCDPKTSATRRANLRETLSSTPARCSVPDQASIQTPTTQQTANTAWTLIDDSHEYEPTKPFARPDFPTFVLDRSPVVGLSPQTYLRTCFRIGEMFREGTRCASLGQDAVIELFGRVMFSFREPGSTKQHFQFADLWHDRPPYPNGLLANYKTTGLAESESKVFITEEGKMARCLGNLKRDLKNSRWMLHIINIRETDWEEIRWTKEIVSHGKVKTEKRWVSASEDQFVD